MTSVLPHSALRSLTPTNSEPRSTRSIARHQRAVPTFRVARRQAATSSTDAAVASTSLPLDELKMQILQHSATVDRGQLHDRLVSGAYEGKRERLRELVMQLCAMQMEKPFIEAELSGDWELVYSSCQLFRSSPFFMAIQAAFNDTSKSSLFFKLHDLQVKSWGTSTVGRVAQHLDFDSAEMRSEFDTILFGLTVIPIVGWFKLLPTFGGRVVTFASDLALDPESGRLDMELRRTRVDPAPGIPKLPLMGNLLMEKDFPVSAVWKILPWNGGRAPKCHVMVKYVDSTFRVMEDPDGELFVYSRPLPTCIED